jgi:hypothetical protein
MLNIQISYISALIIGLVISGCVIALFVIHWIREQYYDVGPLEIIISIVVLVFSLYALFFKADADAGLKQWATGALGAVVGFWLKRD